MVFGVSAIFDAFKNVSTVVVVLLVGLFAEKHGRRSNIFWKMGKHDCEIKEKVSFQFSWLLGLFFHFDMDEQTLMAVKFLGCGTHSGQSCGLSCLQDRI